MYKYVRCIGDIVILQTKPVHCCHIRSETLFNIVVGPVQAYCFCREVPLAGTKGGSYLISYRSSSTQIFNLQGSRTSCS
jgi:hypothetical protein